MIKIINFGHSLSNNAMKQLNNLWGINNWECEVCPTRINMNSDIITQIEQLFKTIKTKIDSDNKPFIIIPGLSIASCTILVKLHTLMCAFPKIIEIKRDPLLDDYLIKGILDLQTLVK